MKWRSNWQRRFCSLLWIGILLSKGCHSKRATDEASTSSDTTVQAHAEKSLDHAQWAALWRGETARRLRPVVYRIEVKARYKYRTDRYSGTGWASDNGYIWTCRHLFPGDGAFDVAIWDHTGKSQKGYLVWRDSVVDAVLLRVDYLPEHRLSMKLDSFPEVGETIYSMGAPMGLLGTLQEGFIAAEARYFQSGTAQAYPLLQLSLPAQPGSSGSPVVDRYGRVIGMISDIASVSGEYEGISFAIPAQVLHQVWERYRSFASK